MLPRTALVSLLLLAAPVAAAEPLQLTGHTRELYTVVWSPAGDKLASTANDGTLRVWTLAGGAPVVIRTGFSSRGVAFSPDGKLVAGRFETGAGIWDATTGTLIAKLAGRDTSADNTVRRVAFSADGKLLAVGHEYGLARLWDVATKSPVAELARPGKLGSSSYCVTALAFSPDGKHLAVGSDGGLVVWDVAARSAVPASPDTAQTLSVSFTPDGTRLVVNESDRHSKFRVWQVGTRADVLTVNSFETPERFLANVAVLSDTLGLGTDSLGRFEYLDLATGTPTGVKLPTVYKDAPGGFAVSPDRKRVAHYRGGNQYTLHVTPLPAAK